LLLNLLVKPAYVLLIETKIQNAVGPEIFGNYAAILSLTYLFNIFLDVGITNFNTRNIAQNQHLLQKHFSAIVTLRTVLSVVYFCVLFIAGSALGYVQEHFTIFLILGINQLLASAILYLRSNLSGLLLFKQDAVVSSMDRALLLISMLVLLLGESTFGVFQIEWLVWGQFGAYLITFFFAIAMVFRKIGSFQFQLNFPLSILIFKRSLPYALLILLSMAYYKTDSVMLEQLLDDGSFHAGIYAMGFRFFEASNMIGFLFAGLLLPLFSRMFQKKEDVDPLASTAFQLLFTIGSIAAVFCFIYAQDILDLFYTEHTAAALQPFRYLMIAFFFVMLSYLFGTMLTAKGELKWLNILALFGVVVNIGLNFYLIPDHHAEGSALASMITQGLVCLLQIVIVSWRIKVRISWKTMMAASGFLGMLTILSVAFTIIQWNWWLEGLLFVSLALVAAVLTRIVRLKHFLEIFDKAA
ncbi:MAG: oligosaccharide flippase family protein, partial [Bacteroidota bacterium]